MSDKSYEHGKAFEYACILELKDRIEDFRPVVVDKPSVAQAKGVWHSISDEDRRKYLRAADAFVDTLFDAEPRILECDGRYDILRLSLNPDSAGIEGDVRDIVIARSSIRWNIGISSKHNHFAVKHSRIAKGLDIGERWYGIPCSPFYWATVNSVFRKLEPLAEQGMLWRDMPNKAETVYIPLLRAVRSEILRAYEKDPGVASRLVAYLISTRDFYKVVAVDSKQVTEFQAFNLRGELNKDGKRTKAALFIPLAALPNEIVEFRFKTDSTNTLELFMNNGWQLSFRIHNAESKVKTTLKFDIQIIGAPAEIITINCVWR